MKKTVHKAVQNITSAYQYQQSKCKACYVYAEPKSLKIVLDELSRLQSENNELRNTISKIKTDLPDEKIRELNPIWVRDEIVKRLTNK
jgi:hypothetical protein